MAAQEDDLTVHDHIVAAEYEWDSSHGKDKEAIYISPPPFSKTNPDQGDASATRLTDQPIIAATHGSSVSPPKGMANISLREYIYFLPYPLPSGTPVPYSTGLPDNNPLRLPPHQFEPTSTLVLTSPNCTFVDIRFLKPTREGEDALPNKGERRRLEWAFAGRSESHLASPNSATRLSRRSEVGQGGEGEEEEEEGEFFASISHSRWHHWLDSRHAVGSTIPKDEGDMYTISSDLTLEHGHAFQPRMQCTKTHEEMWRDIAIRSTTNSGTKICIVLRVQDDAAKVRGLVIRLGQWCQGIVMQDSSSTVERWEWRADEDEGRQSRAENGEWKRVARIGDQYLPCAVTFRPEVLAVEGRVKYWDYEWVVEECWEWK